MCGMQRWGSTIHLVRNAKRPRGRAASAERSFKGCQENHRFIGLWLCEDQRKAEMDGPLRVIKGFCACDPCLMLKNEDCLQPQLVGRVTRSQSPLGSR